MVEESFPDELGLPIMIANGLIDEKNKLFSYISQMVHGCIELVRRGVIHRYFEYNLEISVPKMFTSKMKF